MDNQLISNKNSKIVCRGGRACNHIRKIQKENLISHSSLYEAIMDGYRPCVRCLCEYSVSEIEETICKLLNITSAQFYGQEDIDFDLSNNGFIKAYNLVEDYFSAIIVLQRRGNKGALIRFSELNENVYVNIDDNSYIMYEWNSNCASGGQLIKCLFDDKDAQEILRGKNPEQVLSGKIRSYININSLNFFKNFLNIIDSDKIGYDSRTFVFFDIYDLCKKMITRKPKHGCSPYATHLYYVLFND